MLNSLLPFSGILLITVSWLMLFVPFLLSSGRKCLPTFSDTAYNKKYGKFLNVGLVITGFCQIAFLKYLSKTAGFNSLSLWDCHI